MHFTNLYLFYVAGYGHVAPKTTWGRLVTIVYALVGIPLTFLYLSNIGNFLADCFRMFYKKICCDLCCCQKCERKKKRERMRLKKQREWAAQRNSVLKATASARYTDSSIHDNIIVEDITGGEVIVLPGHIGDFGHDNLTADNDDEDNVQVEEGCLGGCPSPSHNASIERWGDFPDDLRETAILGEYDDVDDVDEYGNVIKETAILDSDTDNETGLKNSGSTNFGPLSNPNRRHSLFNKLDDAKETAILDDSDDEVFIDEQLPTPQPPPVTKSLEKKSKSSSEGSKKRSKSARAVSPTNEDSTKPKSALKKSSSVKVKKKERSKSAEKKQEKESSSSGKERDTLSPARGVSVKEKEKSSLKGKHKASKKLKRKDTKKKKEKDSKKKKSKVQKSVDSGDETRNIMEDERSGAEQINSDDESFVTARAESASFVGEDGDAINDAYQGDVITQQPEKGIITMTTQDGVVKYDPDSVAIDVGTNSPYEIDHLDFRDLSAAQASALGYVDVDFEEEDEDEKVTVPISICLIIIAGYIFGGSVLFTLWEEWDYLTGSYFCFITLSTIGFGDIVPGTDMKEWASSEKLVLCALWLAFGLSLLAMCFNLMQEEVKEKCKWVGQKLGLLRDEDEG